jgi:putative oxidoreductase
MAVIVLFFIFNFQWKWFFMNWFQSCFLFLARFLMAMPFLWSGMYHLFNWQGPLSYWVLSPIPIPSEALITVIAIQLLGGLCLFLGYLTRFFSLVLIGFLLYVSLNFYNFLALDQLHLNELLNVLLKNFSMIGGLLLLVVFGSGSFGLDGKSKKKEKLENKDFDEEA